MDAYWCIQTPPEVDQPSLAAPTLSRPSQAVRQLAQVLLAGVAPHTSVTAGPWVLYSRDHRGRSRRPVALSNTNSCSRSGRFGWHFTLSHGDRFIAAGCSSSRRVGIDVVDHFRGRPAALRWAMTPAELEWADADESIRDLRLLMLWSGKEAAFKASRQRTFQPQRVELQNLDSQPTAQVGTIRMRIQWDLSPQRIVALAGSAAIRWQHVLLR